MTNPTVNQAGGITGVYQFLSVNVIKIGEKLQEVTRGKVPKAA